MRGPEKVRISGSHGGTYDPSLRTIGDWPTRSSPPRAENGTSTLGVGLETHAGSPRGRYVKNKG